jgi:hypothetical protein
MKFKEEVPTHDVAVNSGHLVITAFRALYISWIEILYNTA